MIGPVKGSTRPHRRLVKVVQTSRLGEPLIIATVDKLRVLHSIWKLKHPKGSKISHLDRARKRISKIVHGNAFHLATAQFFAGAAGGATATYSTHWLDTVKVKMQAQPHLYRGGGDCLTSTVRTEGIRGLYRGATPAVLGHMTKASIVFMSYGVCEEGVRRALGVPKDTHLTVAQHASAGALTGVTATLVLCPLEVVKCRLQALTETSNQAARQTGPMSVARDVMRKQGARGFYRGMTGMWAKEIPGSFIYFGSYELAKEVMSHALQKDYSTSKPAVFMSGVFAGLCFCSTHPIESVKTRVQVSDPSKCRGFIHAFMQIIKTEGVPALYSGIKPSMVRACLFSGVQFVIYEAVRDYIMTSRHW